MMHVYCRASIDKKPLFRHSPEFMERSKVTPSILIFIILAMQGLIYTLIMSGSLFLISAAKALSHKQIDIALITVAATSIVIALWAAKLSYQRWALVFRIGMICNIVAAFFLGVETLAATTLPSLDYILFLFSLLLLGAGNGIIFITIPRLIADLYPEKTLSSMILFFTGPVIGNALAPFLLSFSIYLDIVGLLGLFFSLAYFLLLLFFELFSIFTIPTEQVAESATRKGLWIFVSSIFFLSFVETLLANWSLFKYTITDSSSILFHTSIITTFFWISIAVGRLIFGLLFKTVAFKTPVVICSFAILVISVIFFMAKAPVGPLGYILFGLAQASFLPLILSQGQTEYPSNSLVVLGILFSGFWAGAAIANIAFTTLSKTESAPHTLLLVLLLSSTLLFISNLMLVYRRKSDVVLK